MGWTPKRLASVAGKTFVITGGNSGIGLEAAKILTSKGGQVIITSRSAAKAEKALSSIRERTPGADVDFVLLDLADPDSTKACAAALNEKCSRLDALINNAGVMQPPEMRTPEGFELQLGTNHLGHFRLTSLLMPLLEKSKGRVVPVSSIAHKFGEIDLEDLNFETRKYNPIVAYGQSKLANIMFGFELQRRLEDRKSSVVSIPCHPGYSATNLQAAGVGLEGGSKFFRSFYKMSNKFFAQSAEEGAYPLVLAAADESAEPGAYYGPKSFGQTRGPVGKSFIDKRAKQQDVAVQLWEKSEELVGAFFRQD